MEISLTRPNLSRRRIVAIALSLCFVFATAVITLVQAATINKSVTVTIYEDEYMTVDLQIHNYNYNPNPDFCIFHAILKVTSRYNVDILVKTIYIESWSDPKYVAGALMYGSGERTDIVVPAGETTVMRLNMKSYHFSELISDPDVYSYYSINWVHGANEYTKFGLHMESALDWWNMLY